MNFKLDTSDLENGFAEVDIALIRDQFLAAAALTNRHMPIDGVSVIFLLEEKPFWGPVWGVAASAPDAHSMYFHFSPQSFLLQERGGQERYSAVAAHELHHAKRWQTQGYGTSYGEMMVTEGLALCFQRETGHGDFHEERSLRGETLASMTAKAIPILDRNCFAWEDAAIRDSVDRYALGLHVVEGWCKFSGISAADAHDVPARAIIEPWFDGKFTIGSEATP